MGGWFIEPERARKWRTSTIVRLGENDEAAPTIIVTRVPLAGRNAGTLHYATLAAFHRTRQWMRFEILRSEERVVAGCAAICTRVEYDDGSGPVEQTLLTVEPPSSDPADEATVLVFTTEHGRYDDAFELFVNDLRFGDAHEERTSGVTFAPAGADLGASPPWPIRGRHQGSS